MEERELQLDLAQESKKFVRVIQKTNYCTGGLRGRASIIASCKRAYVYVELREIKSERGGSLTTRQREAS